MIDLKDYVNENTYSDNDCLIWSLRTNKFGYGLISGRLQRLHTTQLAHRALYHYYNGSIPAGLVVMHSCDNPSCVNIDHLSLGTVADNNRDRKEKGRNADTTGENNPSTKLTVAHVVFIRKNKGIFTCQLMADVFNVDRTTVSHISNGKNWPIIINGESHGYKAGYRGRTETKVQIPTIAIDTKKGLE